MNNLRQRFNRFCYRNRDKGIPNLMLYVSLGSALVYLITMITGNPILYSFLFFDRSLILHGQVWRLISYPLVYNAGSIFLTFISLFCYYTLGRAMENMWGTFRFNLYYFSGIIMMDIYCMIFGGVANVTYLNLSLFLAYATMFPQAQFLLFFIIPIKAWVLVLFDLVLCAVNLITYPFPYNLFSVISLANYFLFFGKDILNVVPMSWRANAHRAFGKKPQSKGPKVVPFPKAGSYEASTATPKAPYTHKCTVCGRTDVSNPELEFRYCSKCKGYYCYCSDHINNHEHIT